jgi:hypothetical protein
VTPPNIKTSGGAVTRTISYYPAAGAMRINSTLYYVLKDHLGSASVVTDASGDVVGEQRYYPFPLRGLCGETLKNKNPRKAHLHPGDIFGKIFILRPYAP